MTDAERKLWHRLRANQLGLKFRRQHPFENYIVDFVCLPAKLIVEVDGGQHQDHAGQDAQRTVILEKAGFRVLRFWNNQVLAEIDSVVEAIKLSLETHPHPSLPPEGEGVKPKSPHI
jgi:very-short-patch-repair endonuclease